jgi:hypothetical protein
VYDDESTRFCCSYRVVELREPERVLAVTVQGEQERVGTVLRIIAGNRDQIFSLPVSCYYTARRSTALQVHGFAAPNRRRYWDVDAVGSIGAEIVVRRVATAADLRRQMSLRDRHHMDQPREHLLTCSMPVKSKPSIKHMRS